MSDGVREWAMSCRKTTLCVRRQRGDLWTVVRASVRCEAQHSICRKPLPVPVWDDFPELATDGPQGTIPQRLTVELFWQEAIPGFPPHALKVAFGVIMVHPHLFLCHYSCQEYIVVFTESSNVSSEDCEKTLFQLVSQVLRYTRPEHILLHSSSSWIFASTEPTLTSCFAAVTQPFSRIIAWVF